MCLPKKRAEQSARPNKKSVYNQEKFEQKLKAPMELKNIIIEQSKELRWS
jgi:hypothetical protein